MAWRDELADYHGFHGMYAITDGFDDIDGFQLQTWSREILSANIICVTAGTTGYRGGDGGHGCVTLFRIKDLGGTAFDAKADLEAGTVEIALYGDTELSTFVEALKWAVHVYEAEIEKSFKEGNHIYRESPRHTQA